CSVEETRVGAVAGEVAGGVSFCNAIASADGHIAAIAAIDPAKIQFLSLNIIPRTPFDLGLDHRDGFGINENVYRL
ncbi:MAG TPA: hypothetical protein VK210_02175, partial [Terriglobia bacterium]|nr:hypothetical protein [Terriglobia bacterium]